MQPEEKLLPVGEDIKSLPEHTDQLTAEDAVQKLTDIFIELGESPDIDKYKQVLKQIFESMNSFAEAGIISKDEHNKYKSDNSDGEKVIKTFVDTIKAIQKKKPAKPKGKESKKDKSPKLQQRPTGSSSPIAIEMDGKTFNSPGEAYDHANKLRDGAEKFRQRYFGLLTGKLETLNVDIDNAIKAVETVKRINTQGKELGINDILRPLIDKKIIRLRHGIYEANPYIIGNAKEVNTLIKSATDKRREILKKIDDDKKAFEKRKKSREAYDKIMKSENGFERSIKNKKGKEVARFAFKINVEELKNSDIIEIGIDKIAIKFGRESSVPIKEGEKFIYGDSKTPYFINNAAKKLLAKRRRHDEKKGISRIGKMADVMPDSLKEKAV